MQEQQPLLSIKITREMLDALFPEGTEARANLIRSVAIEFAKKCMTKEFEGGAWSLIRNAVTDEVSRMLMAQKEDFGIKTIESAIRGNKVTALTDSFREKIKQELLDDQRQMISHFVSEQIAAIRAEVDGKVKIAIENIPDHIYRSTRESIVKQLNDALKAAPSS